MTEQNMLTRRVMAALEGGSKTMSEVAAVCGIDERTAGKTLHALTARGLLNKVTLYGITDRGNRLLNNTSPAVIRERVQRKRERERLRQQEKRQITPAPTKKTVSRKRGPARPVTVDDESDLNCPARIKRMAEETVRSAMNDPHLLHAVWGKINA